LSSDERLNQLLLQYEEQRQRGAEVVPEEMCHGCPELLDVFRQRIKELSAIDRLLAQTTDSDAAEHGPCGLPAIPGFEVLEELGRGGMGVVYKARQLSLGRLVALKLVLSGAHASSQDRARLRTEAEAIARLQHPHIAQIHDVAMHDGKPFLVLEYVDGTSLDRRQERCWPARQAAELIECVARALDAAHERRMVHRDLKPSNILVSSDGRVHLLDFGIAKLINPTISAAHMPVTRMDLRAMTPEYASPEQVRGDSLTTASDIYSLGVLLYELLCGCRPYQLTTSSPVEVATAVCEQDPVRPSVRASRGESGASQQDPQVSADLRNTTIDRLTRQLKGDLDSIVLLAMRKEPGRRYASADMMRQDIERHLSGMPVLAHRGNQRYRIQKFLRRHRVEATAAALVIATLLIGFTVAVRESRKASRERDRAAQALAESEGVTDFLMQLFDTGDDVTPAQLSALDLVKRGAARANELSNQPTVHARLLDVVGQMSLHLGQYDDAQRWLEQAIALRRSALGPQSLDLASSLIHLARVHRVRNEYERAQTLVNEALQIRQAALPENHPEIGEAFYELGWLSAGAPQERLYRQALTILPDTGTAADLRVTVLQALTTNLRRQGKLADAVAAGREAISVAERAFGAEHAITGYAMVHLADQVRDIEGDATAAQQLYRRGLDIMARQLGQNNLRLIHGLHSLGTLLSSLGNREAEQLFRRALTIRQSATGPEHPSTAEGLQLLAGELARQGRLYEAETLARRALDLSQRTLGERHRLVTDSRMPMLADILDRQGRRAASDSVYRSALSLTTGSITRGEMHRDYARILLRRGDYSAAEQQLLQSLQVLEQFYGGAVHPNVQETKRSLMNLYRQWGKPDLVERYRVPPGRYVPY
jgi:serine/threonine protein kinase